MTATIITQHTHYRARVASSHALSEPTWLRWLLIALALAFLSVFLFVPLAAVFTEALR